MNSPIFNDAFQIQPLKLDVSDTFRQVLEKDPLNSSKFRYNYNERRPVNQAFFFYYPAFLENKGLLDSHDSFRNIPVFPTPMESKDYKGEVYLLNNQGNLSITFFSPNKVKVNLNLNNDDILILNQNFYEGWRVKIDSETYDAKSYNGLISVDVSSKNKEIIFYFFQNSFLFGLLISLISIFIIFYLLINKRNFYKFLI